MTPTQLFYIVVLFILSSFKCFSTQSETGIILNLICQANCLKTFKLEASAADSFEIKRKPFLIESFCLKDSKCKMCSAACSNYDKTLKVCQQKCQELMVDSSSITCMQSCEFIESKKVNRPGVCPSVISQLKCSQSCQTDTDCFKQGTKCCKHVICGNICQIANRPTTDVPPVPGAPIVRQIIDKKDRDQINVDLDWSSYDLLSVDYPVLFLVQVRVGQPMRNENRVDGIWRDLISTTKSGVLISAIDPENWYQFRLLAFSKNGYKNHGAMTTPFTVQYKPTYPVSPKNVTEKVSRIVDKHISVTLTWQPGESNSLVPISNYKINWRKFHEMYVSNPVLTEYEIIIPATETSYTLLNLSPSTIYRVEVTSVIVYKDVKYNSTATVYFLTTLSIPNNSTLQLDASSPIKTNSIDDCACGNSYQQLPVVVNNATIVNGRLAMLVKLKDGIEFDNTFAPYSFRMSWYPTACIESNFWRVNSEIAELPQSIVVNNNINHYITGLRLQCTYQLEVELFSQLAKKKIKIWEGCFCTPNCNIVAKQNDGIMSLCQGSDQYIPPTPNNLRISLIKSDTDSTSNAQLEWDCNPSTSVTAFRITWGPRLEEPIEVPMYSNGMLPILDAAKATSKVVKYPHQKLLLKNLEVDKIYLVKLQSMNYQVSSQESVLFFKVHFDKNSSNNPSRFRTVLLLLPLSIVILTSIL